MLNLIGINVYGVIVFGAAGYFAGKSFDKFIVGTSTGGWNEAAKSLIYLGATLSLIVCGKLGLNTFLTAPGITATEQAATMTVAVAAVWAVMIFQVTNWYWQLRKRTSHGQQEPKIDNK